jgi:uncharacterized cupredoxin-like copper-binding protein
VDLHSATANTPGRIRLHGAQSHRQPARQQGRSRATTSARQLLRSTGLPHGTPDARAHKTSNHLGACGGSALGKRLTSSERTIMRITRRQWLALASGLAASVGAASAFAAGRVIRVSLWDRGAMPMNWQGQGTMMGRGALGQNMPMAHMGISVSTSTVAAGVVTFEVKNASKDLVHEMVISPIKDGRTALPYIQATNKVDEDAAGHLGEVAELAPGKSGALKLTLKPGRYILYCNVAGHYALGMWTLLTVK